MNWKERLTPFDQELFAMVQSLTGNCEAKNGGTHYFNKINGQYVDLTREQFDLYDLPVNYEPNQEISREYCARIHTNVTNSCSEISYNI